MRSASNRFFSRFFRAILVRGLSDSPGWETVFCSCGATDAAGVGAAVEVKTGGDGCGLFAACADGVPPETALLGSARGSRTSFGVRLGVADGVAAGEPAATGAATTLCFPVICLKVKKAANPMTTSTPSAHRARILVAKIFDEFRRRRTPLDKFLVRVLSGKR